MTTDDEGWILVWKRSHMENTTSLHVLTCSYHISDYYKISTTYDSRWYYTNKKCFNLIAYTIVAYHQGKIIYNYKGIREYLITSMT